MFPPPNSQLGPPGAEPQPAPLPDAELVRGLLAGDRRLAGVLYDRLRPSIDLTLRRVLRQRDADFEDLVQGTFERVLKGLAAGTFSGRSQLKTWASGIASHVALDALRLKQRERARFISGREEEGVASPFHRTDHRAEVQAELQRVQRILSDMRPELAQTLVLHDVLGHKLSEIADLQKASESAAQSRLRRARLELRRRAERSIPRRKS